MKDQFNDYLSAMFYNEGPLIIGLTGYTGSGNSTAKGILSQEEKIIIPGIQSINAGVDQNFQIDKRYYERIKAGWAEVNWQKFTTIEVSKIIFAFFLNKLTNENARNNQEKEIVKYIKQQKVNLEGLQHIFDQENNMSKEEAKKLVNSYESAINIYKHFKSSFDKKELGDFITLLQDLGDEIRRYGSVEIKKTKRVSSPKHIYVLPKSISRIISAYVIGEEAKYFVIDTFKNPFEIEYFKHTYSSFYVVGVLREIDDRQRIMLELLIRQDFKKIDEREKTIGVKKNKDNISKWITSQDIDECLNRADMFILNKFSKTKTYEHLKFGLIKLISLNNKPGCFTPTTDERCMEVAMSVRLSSGCISRQVGAVVIDSNKRVLGVGWNDPPKGQVACAFRTCKELVYDPSSEIFSEYERTPEFVEHVKKLNRENKPFCFRTQLARFKKESKKAEYTRALHAEENALFQAMSNGRKNLNGATLYTTSSTCTLCAKKAYQLGIERIVFIDEYYDMAIPQTLKAGDRNIELTRFTGIIGSTYHELFLSPMPEKSILNLQE